MLISILSKDVHEDLRRNKNPQWYPRIRNLSSAISK
jgi:hypothetical protein